MLTPYMTYMAVLHNLTLIVFLLGTNINDAVLKGVNMLIHDRQGKILPERSIDMIILLTDGMPNYGEKQLCIHVVQHCRFVWTHV